LVEVAGEPYAFPLTQITRALKVHPANIETLESRPHFSFGGQPVGLLAAHQVFDCTGPTPPGGELPVVVLGDHNARYGLVVDRFLGERELVVQPLDARLGKVKDISAAALMEDGSPVLIVDVDDVLKSIEQLVREGPLAQVQHNRLELIGRKQKRVLAVDDSLTVRELVRKLLASRGYLADVAVDGMEGWNAVRTGHYDLVITDVDMPRLDGIELATLIKKDPRLKSLPVMIISYKDREEDRLRGLEAGADYYITKGSFHDETLLQAVVDLIGDPDT
jgi:two-component system sensor histidine kinase and response regulator WspE